LRHEGKRPGGTRLVDRQIDENTPSDVLVGRAVVKTSTVLATGDLA